MSGNQVCGIAETCVCETFLILSYELGFDLVSVIFIGLNPPMIPVEVVVECLGRYLKPPETELSLGSGKLTITAQEPSRIIPAALASRKWKDLLFRDIEKYFEASITVIDCFSKG
mmetsp:Transcript_28601/g.39868  ORF Transcript_28601/g.39868 Transcript_28601/m.39868 type:complete len:115 (-) Transcript_28601:117-461(-)